MSRADRNIKWIEDYCCVPEGRDVGKKVKLREWQRNELRRIYDNPAGTRRAILSFGRKNGKTALAAFILLLHLVGPEHRRNSQLYSAAQSRDQAAILFSLAAKMVRMSPELREHVGVRDTAKQLYCPDLGTLYRALSADASTAYGLSPVLIVHDELGQVKGPRSELYEALETATGAQDSPLSIVISTQAPTDADLLSLLIEDGMAAHDARVVVSLYTAPEDLDPFSEKAIRAANPAFGDFQNAEEVMAMAEDARRMPSRESEYRNLILNQRISTFSPFVSRSVWEMNGEPPGDMEGKKVYCGLDLSSRADLTALVIAWQEDGAWHMVPRFWAPQEGVMDRARRDRTPYDVWAQQGFLQLTPGATVDYGYVAVDIAETLSVCDVQKVSFDRWRIDVLRREFDAIGLDLPLQEFGQGYRDMSPALDMLEAELLNGRIRHGAHPVLTMCFANAVTSRDPAGNRKLDKHRAVGRIDGAVAAAMALGGYAKEEVEKPPAFDMFFV